MTKSICGVEVKIQAKALLWIHLIENLSFYVLSLAVMIQSQKSRSDQLTKENTTHSLSACELSNFGVIFSLIGIIIAIFCLVIEKPKKWKIAFLLHQGISIELFALVLSTLMLSERFAIQFVTPVAAPLAAMTLLKIYSWYVILSSIKVQRDEERREMFGAQWITNSLLGYPNVGLSLPVPEAIQTKERF